MESVKVHPRIANRHPEIKEDDVLTAWRNAIRCQRRIGIEADHFAAIGVDRKGRLLELVAAKGSDDMWLVFHAMKATQAMLDELGLKDGRSKK